jgi:hypothetical protein
MHRFNEPGPPRSPLSRLVSAAIALAYQRGHRPGAPSCSGPQLDTRRASSTAAFRRLNYVTVHFPAKSTTVPPKQKSPRGECTAACSALSNGQHGSLPQQAPWHRLLGALPAPTPGQAEIEAAAPETGPPFSPQNAARVCGAEAGAVPYSPLGEGLATVSRKEPDECTRRLCRCSIDRGRDSRTSRKRFQDWRLAASAFAKAGGGRAMAMPAGHCGQCSSPPCVAGAGANPSIERQTTILNRRPVTRATRQDRIWPISARRTS